MFTFVVGVIYENEAGDKTIEIRKLAPSKGKRISPDGNCLFSSLSYVITGTDYYHTEIRELLIQNMTNKYRYVQIIAVHIIPCFLNIIVLQLKTTLNSV